MRVEELLQKKHIHFVPKGRDLLVHCLNPDHEDTNPSMRIDKVTGVYNCFSCGFRGNIFTDHKEVPDEVQILRDRLKSKILDKYTENVGLSMPKNIEMFEDSWRGISAETYKKFNAFVWNQEEFKDRLWFPITDFSGKIVVFLGRSTMNEKPKYLFEPRHVKIPLYPVVKPESGRILLVEGIFDVMNLHDKGITNAMCLFGVNNFNEDRLNTLKMLGAHGIDILLDPDEAGQEGAKKIEEICEKMDMPHRNVRLKNNDPGELDTSAILRLREKLYD